MSSHFSSSPLPVPVSSSSSSPVPSSCALELLDIAEAILFSIPLPGPVLTRYRSIRSELIEKHTSLSSHSLFSPSDVSLNSSLPSSIAAQTEKLHRLKKKTREQQDRITELENENAHYLRELHSITSSSSSQLSSAVDRVKSASLNAQTQQIQRIQQDFDRRYSELESSLTSQLSHLKDENAYLHRELMIEKDEKNKEIQRKNDELSWEKEGKTGWKCLYNELNHGILKETTSLQAIRTEIEDYKQDSLEANERIKTIITEIKRESKKLNQIDNNKLQVNNHEQS
jgi:hypothetical protein